MEFTMPTPDVVPLVGEQQAFALALTGAAVEQALAVLLQAFERATPGVGVAVHGDLLAADAVGARVSCGPALAPFCTRLDGLPRDQSPVVLALASLRPVRVDDSPQAGAGATRWSLCRALMREHGVRRCRFEPLPDASRQSAVGVLACLEREGAAAGETDVAGLLRAAALLLGHDRRLRQRELEARQRREGLRMLAHDLRNLIAPLRTALEVLARPHADVSAVQRLHAIMVRQVAQLVSLPDEIARLAGSGVDACVQEPARCALPEAAGGMPRVGPAAGAPSQAGPAADRTRRRVLVADDNEQLRESFVALLAAEGFDVRGAADGAQAVEMADAWEPDVVLLDIHMPRLNGFETARRLRAAHPPQQMTLLMLSGITLNDAWVRHAKAAGFDDCLDKSADPRAWLARVRQRAVH